MTDKTQVTIGCDPEIFAFNTKTGMPVSVHDLLPGDKQEPFRVPRGAIQVDGTAAEFNIAPAVSLKAFLRSIERVRGILDVRLRKGNPDLEFRIQPTAVFDKTYFEELPYGAMALGCEADYSAYSNLPNPKPMTSEPFRTASGHVHIGWTKDADVQSQEHFNTCRELVYELDFTLYHSSLLWDRDEKRRELYGNPGAFRPKPYGLEYRVLSNMWLQDKTLQSFVFSSAKATAMKHLKGHEIARRFKKTRIDIDRDFAEYSDFLTENNLPSPRGYGIVPEGYQNVA